MILSVMSKYTAFTFVFLALFLCSCNGNKVKLMDQTFFFAFLFFIKD